MDLPWAKRRDFAVGEFARRHGAEVPERTVGAAKSWLAHSRVDRHQPLLPWGASADVPKISPVTASQRYLEHLVAAWEAAFPRRPVARQIVVLTVPASFDASARELTREAALAAGLPQDLVLLEEPQAAVYAWLADRGQRWRQSLALGDTLLVCDVGGGTTDLTLVGVAEEQGELVLQRLAVGNHLLVGGDNMDLALAHFVAGRFAEKGVKLDPWQSVALWHSCRTAKEALLAGGPEGVEKYPVAVLGRGSRRDRRHGVDRSRSRGRQPLAPGRFLPAMPSDRSAGPPGGRRFPRVGSALRGRHGRHPPPGRLPPGARPVRKANRCVRPTCSSTAAFSSPRPCAGGSWTCWAGVVRHRRAAAEALGRPARSGPCRRPRRRLLRLGQAAPAACGFAAASAGPITSASRPPGWPCPGPRGRCGRCASCPWAWKRAIEADVPSDEIGLVVGQPGQFRFFSSSVRKEDRPGDVLESWTADELEETDSLEATLPAVEGSEDAYVPVRFHSRITELGVLELWCVGTKHPGRWKLEFSVREAAGGES